MVKNRLMNLLVVALVLGVSATSSFAQGQGGRGRGGFGGFGGGGFGARDVLSLIGSEEVVKELALSEEAAGKLKTLSSEIREELGKARGGREAFAGLRELPEEERNKKMAELREKGEEASKKVRETYLPKVKEVLTAEQFARVQQIVYQANPLTVSLADAEVIKALDLSKEQQDKIAAIGKEYGEKTRALFTGGNAGGGREKMQELNKERDTAIAGVLTADQSTKWTEMKGKEFDVAKLRGGAGGPGGRGAGGRRPGGNAGRPATE